MQLFVILFSTSTLSSLIVDGGELTIIGETVQNFIT